MKREFLKKMKLTDEQIDAIMAENGKDVNGLKEQVNSLTFEGTGQLPNYWKGRPAIPTDWAWHPT